jgi:hypothetical protein
MPGDMSGQAGALKRCAGVDMIYYFLLLAAHARSRGLFSCLVIGSKLR